MSDGGQERLSRDLDRIALHASDALRGAAGETAFARGLRRALPLAAAIPAAYIVLQVLAWAVGASPRLLPLVVVAIAAIGVPVVLAMRAAAAAKSREVHRTRALGAADDQLHLEGRLLAADEFLQRRSRSGFEEAAVEDAETRSEAAAAASIDAEHETVDLRRSAYVWGTAAVVALVVAALLGTLEPRPGPKAPLVATVDAEPGTPVEADADEERDPIGEVTPAEPPRPEPGNRGTDETTESRDAETAPDASDAVKESAGKTGTGRSAGALSSSAASESRSAPSTQGQTSKPPDRDPKAKESEKKKPKDDKEQPVPERRPEDEESGATAGRGSSKGSNKNPTASDWQSKDQVTESDDQEIEDDEDTDDDEEEQENRGGVQPSLRDRRPPVSRDLQIGFGNRPNPDANGRGGPSEQKKSRGVASLVLGVPIPDRIKGRPGPGPTKITQERIEPQAEDATGADASSRTPRTSPIGRLSSLDLPPHLRALVRSYFTARREASQ